MHGLLLRRSLLRVHRMTLQQSQIIFNNWRFYSSSSSKPQASEDFNYNHQSSKEEGKPFNFSRVISQNESSVSSRSESSNEQDNCGVSSNVNIIRGDNQTMVGGDGSSAASAWLDKLVYSSYMEKFVPPRGYRSRLKERFETKVMEMEEMVGKTAIMPPVSVKYLLESQGDKKEEGRRSKVGREETQEEKEEDNDSIVQFPYKISRKTEFVEDEGVHFEAGRRGRNEEASSEEPVAKIESVADRLRKQEIDPESVLEDDPHNLSDIFEAAAEVCIEDEGTEDPSVPASNVPCGGCGALLHCQDKSVPGYIASEKFKNAKKADLRADVCYRCSVLEAHQATLNVNVSVEDYPRIVSKIREQFAMVLLIVDLTDFPCSIWPGILNIIGSRRPIILVGNKVDLLPQDSPDYLRRVEDSLIKSAVDVGMLEANIIHTTLISAKTGYGVEKLITSVFNLIKGKGDIFIMGCTNVGKSSLFNVFLQSDLCKPQVCDLVQEATVSQWPGTTLNLLKFPMTVPSGWAKVLRGKRLSNEAPVKRADEKEREAELRATRDPEHAVLTEPVGKTFISTQKQDAIDSAVTVNDIFHVNPRSKTAPPTKRPGQWNPDEPQFRMSHWVYDTPGAVNTNQILDLLTLPELMQSLPKSLIQPRTFYVKQNISVFIGGLARLDFIEGPHPIRYTIFSNNSLPVTMSLMEDAEMVYQKALGTKVFAVPSGGSDRLAQFPKLESKSVELEGTGHTYSCADIVLSSIGWVAVTAGQGQKFRLLVATPNGKGIFIRQPALLPYAVNFKGKRARGTYSYQPHQVYVGPRNYRKNR